MNPHYNRITVCAQPPATSSENPLFSNYVYMQQPISPSSLRNTSPQTLPPPAAMVPPSMFQEFSFQNESADKGSDPSKRQIHFTTLDQLQASHVKFGETLYRIPHQESNIYDPTEKVPCTTDSDYAASFIPLASPVSKPHQEMHPQQVKQEHPIDYPYVVPVGIKHSVSDDTLSVKQDAPVGMKTSISEVTLSANDSASIGSGVSNTSNRIHLDASIDSANSGSNASSTSQLDLQQPTFFESRSTSTGSCSSIKTVAYGVQVNGKDPTNQHSMPSPSATTTDNIVRKNEPCVTSFRQFKRRGRPKKDPLKEAEAIRKQYQQFLIEQENQANIMKRKLEVEEEGAQIKKQKVQKYENNNISTRTVKGSPDPAYKATSPVESSYTAQPILSHSYPHGNFQGGEVNQKKYSTVYPESNVPIHEENKHVPQEVFWYNPTHIHIDQRFNNHHTIPNAPIPQNIVFCTNSNVFPSGVQLVHPSPIIIPTHLAPPAQIFAPGTNIPHGAPQY